MNPTALTSAAGDVILQDTAIHEHGHIRVVDEHVEAVGEEEA